MRHEVVHVRNSPAFKGFRSEWDRLADASPTHSLSVTYQYCELAAAHMSARGGQVYVIKIYDENGLSLLWPLVVFSKGLVRVLRDLTCGTREEYGGPLLRSDTSLACVRAAIHAMKEIKADVFEIAWIEDGSDLHRVVSRVPQPWIVRLTPRRISAAPGGEGLPRYAINLRGHATWDDFMATRQRSVRANHNRRLRKLMTEQKNVEFGWCTTVEDAERVLKWLFANKRSWAEVRGIRTSYLMDHNLRDFCIGMARRTELRTTPLVSYIKVGGVPAAASFNLVGPKIVEGFVTTYDKAFKPYSIGILMLTYLAKWAHENNKDFDMRHFHADYKAHWANHSVVCRRHNVFLASNNLTATATLAALAAYQVYDFCHRGFRKVGRITRAKVRSVGARLAAPAPQQDLEQQTG